MKIPNFVNYLVIVASAIIVFNCEKNPIPYNLNDTDVKIDTLTIYGITGGTYLSPPLMGSTAGLYFGEKDGNRNIFSIFRLRNLSLNNTIYTHNLLDDDVTMDSLVFTFTALDSALLTEVPEIVNTTFELYYFPQGGDSVFSEDESNYLNLTENDVAGAVAIGQGHFIENSADSLSIQYPQMSIKINELEDVLNFIADTSDTQNRAFLLKNIDPIDQIVAIRSRESSNYPILTAHYRVGEDTLETVFYPNQDITIVEPRPVTNDDMEFLTVNRAAGLKSIIQFDLSAIPLDSNNVVFKTAELYMHAATLDSLNDINIIATVLDTSIEVTEYWEIDDDIYNIDENSKMSGYFDFDLLGIQIRKFLQGYMTGSYENYGLKIYSSTTTDPFRNIHLLIDQDDKSLNPYLKITYVKL